MEYLIVDGYNILFSWQELRSLAQENMDAARMSLADILCNYQGFRKNNIILVYDGYKAKGNLGSVIQYNNIEIVYTKEDETADQYIERITQELGKVTTVRVATSDAIEQSIILGQGATRMSARELKLEIEETERQIREVTEERTKKVKRRNSIMDNLPPDMAKELEKMRLKRD